MTGDRDDRIQAGDFQTRYQNWAKTNGIKNPQSNVAIGTYMKNRYEHDQGRVTFYVGLRWNEPAEAESQAQAYGDGPPDDGAGDDDGPDWLAVFEGI